MEADSRAAALRGVRAVMGVVSASLARAFEQVTPPQLRVLVLLRSVGRMQVGDLGALLDLSPSGATRAAARMERDGWIRRVRTDGDRRAVSLRLTARGEGLVDEVLRARQAELDRALQRMSEADREVVLRGLTILADSLAEPADDAGMQILGFAPEPLPPAPSG